MPAVRRKVTQRASCLNLIRLPSELEYYGRAPVGNGQAAAGFNTVFTAAGAAAAAAGLAAAFLGAAAFLATGFLAAAFLGAAAFVATGFLAAAFLGAAAFLAAGFLATAFLAAGFLAAAFLGAAAFLATGFLATAFFATGFLAAAFLGAAAFLATGFLATAFFATGFLAAAFLGAAAFLATGFLATAFFATGFLAAGAFLAAGFAAAFFVAVAILFLLHVMEKIKLLRFETLLAHRDEQGGLFIGASTILFALMNSAPAELLHLLTYAALQPSFGYATHTPSGSNSQKNAGNNAGIGILFQKKQSIFQRKSRLARQGQVQRRKQIRSVRSSTVHLVGYSPSVFAVF